MIVDAHNSRLYVSHESKLFRTYPSLGNIDFSIAKSGFCNNFEEILIDTN